MRVFREPRITQVTVTCYNLTSVVQKRISFLFICVSRRLNIAAGIYGYSPVASSEEKDIRESRKVHWKVPVLSKLQLGQISTPDAQDKWN